MNMRESPRENAARHASSESRREEEILNAPIIAITARNHPIGWPLWRMSPWRCFIDKSAHFWWCGQILDYFGQILDYFGQILDYFEQCTMQHTTQQKMSQGRQERHGDAIGSFIIDKSALSGDVGKYWIMWANTGLLWAVHQQHRRGTDGGKWQLEYHLLTAGLFLAIERVRTPYRPTVTIQRPTITPSLHSSSQISDGEPARCATIHRCGKNNSWWNFCRISDLRAASFQHSFCRYR